MKSFTKTEIAGLFSCRDYKVYVRQRLEEGGHGDRRRLADYLGCQPSFVSQVLNGSAHFSLEHADRLNGFFRHEEAEADYFVVLVQFARAGTKSLARHFQRQLDAQREDQLILKKRVAPSAEISADVQARYYANWLPAAVHVLISIPQFRTAQEIAVKLGVRRELVQETLALLVELGLAKVKEGIYQQTKALIHLGNHSAFLPNHHRNWRLRAVEACEQRDPQNLHYSCVATLSREDFLNLKEAITALIEATIKRIAASPEEIVCAIGMDLFELGR